MRKLFLFITVIFLCSVRAIAIEDCGCEHHHHSTKNVEIKKGSILDVRDCIAIGVKNSPVIKEFAHRLEIAKSNVGIAKSAYFPEFGVGAGYRQEFNSNSIDYARNYRELPAVGVALNKMIWDFGRTTANVKMEEFLKIAAEYEFEDTVCKTVFNIKLAYYNLLKEIAYEQALKTNLELQQELIKEIKKLVASGKKNNADLINAQVELLKIKAELVKSGAECKNSQENLSNAIYLKNAPDYSIYDTQSFIYSPAGQKTFKNVYLSKTPKIANDDTIFQYPDFTYNKAVEIAYNNSPDIKALVAVRNSFEQALISVKKSYYPSLNAGVGYDFVNSNLFSNNGLNVAVTIDASINAMKQKYDVKSAKSQLALADTEIETFKDDLYFTVRKCLNDVKASHDNLAVYKDKMVAAAENFDLTFNNYKSDKMNQLELEHSREEYFNSLKDYINSQFDYNISLIKLEMAMHEHLIDYHDDAEHAADFHEGDESDTLSKLIKCNKKHKP